MSNAQYRHTALLTVQFSNQVNVLHISLSSLTLVTELLGNLLLSLLPGQDKLAPCPRLQGQRGLLFRVAWGCRRLEEIS